MLIITFDEWGGFFEHVAPPRVIAPNGVDTDQVSGNVLLGFRIPAIIVSPFTTNITGCPNVSHTVFDHTSILKLIEWRWGLAPLTLRDASEQIGNPATSMNFVNPKSVPPTLPAAPTVSATPCVGGGIFNSVAGVSREELRRAAPPRTEWGALAGTAHTRQWLQHSRFGKKLKEPNRTGRSFIFRRSPEE